MHYGPMMRPGKPVAPQNLHATLAFLGNVNVAPFVDRAARGRG
ncbi:MAG: hypothetical protein EPN89_10030 [Methylovulum sp.]|nr:MAG: hypothetical protein EPN89_10030 [Methylovulum sp.]